MGLLKDADKQHVSKEFEPIDRAVVIKYFSTDDSSCMYCKEIGELLSEVAALNENIKFEQYKKGDEKTEEVMKEYGIDTFPSFVITDDKNSVKGVRFFGIPAGYEFISLMSAIKEMGTGHVDLADDIKDEIAKIDKPVHFKVFVTPSCPHCPRAVMTVHKYAMLNSNITGDMWEAQEFPQESMKYNVHAVPRVIINEEAYFEGALPDRMFLDSVYKALEGEKGNVSVYPG